MIRATDDEKVSVQVMRYKNNTLRPGGVGAGLMSVEEFINARMSEDEDARRARHVDRYQPSREYREHAAHNNYNSRYDRRFPPPSPSERLGYFDARALQVAPYLSNPRDQRQHRALHYQNNPVELTAYRNDRAHDYYRYSRTAAGENGSLHTSGALHVHPTVRDESGRLWQDLTRVEMPKVRYEVEPSEKEITPVQEQKKVKKWPYVLTLLLTGLLLGGLIPILVHYEYGFLSLIFLFVYSTCLCTCCLFHLCTKSPGGASKHPGGGD